MNIRTPQELVATLLNLFPAFEKVWGEGEAYGDKGRYNYHTVFMELVPVYAGLLSKASPWAFESFCTIINEFVSSGGIMERAVSTCLLEHASQIGIATTIRPHLSNAAKFELV